MALHNQETRGGGGDRDYHRLRICVKLHIEQTQRSKNFWNQNEVMERGTVIKGEKGQKSFTRRKTGECFQWKRNGSCSKGRSCSFLHEPAVGKPLHALEQWEIHVDLAWNQPRETVRKDERMKDKHPPLYQK